MDIPSVKTGQQHYTIYQATQLCPTLGTDLKDWIRIGSANFYFWTCCTFLLYCAIYCWIAVD